LRAIGVEDFQLIALLGQILADTGQRPGCLGSQDGIRGLIAVNWPADKVVAAVVANILPDRRDHILNINKPLRHVCFLGASGQEEY